MKRLLTGAIMGSVLTMAWMNNMGCEPVAPEPLTHERMDAAPDGGGIPDASPFNSTTAVCCDFAQPQADSIRAEIQHELNFATNAAIKDLLGAVLFILDEHGATP